MVVIKLFFCKFTKVILLEYMTVPGKIRHSAQILDVEILVLPCSALFAPYRGEVGFSVPHTIPE